MPQLSRSLFVLLVVCAVVLTAAPASAQEPPAETPSRAHALGRIVRAADLLDSALAGTSWRSWQQGEPGGQVQAGNGNGPLLVFLDCSAARGRFDRGGPCDFDFLRREVTFINYVRDRQDADVHVLVTRREAGAATEFTLDFIGLENFEGDDIQQRYSASNTNTRDETRREFAQVLRAGLLHYVGQTPLIQRMQIGLEGGPAEPAEGADEAAMTTAQEDPWNFWVFRINVRGELEAEDRRTRRNVNFNFSANRTTPEWKIRIGNNFRYDERTFELSDGEEVLSFTRSYGVTHQTVKSLGDHWGAGIKASIGHATFLNQDLTAFIAPGIEYNIFPYEESSRRQLTFTYEVGTAYYRYEEITIFEETEELLFDHSFLVNYDVNQPWGGANLGLETAQFFNDLSQWRVVVDARVNFRITRGLSFNVNGEYSAIRDQRFLPLEELADEDVLLRRQALATNSEYEISFGVTYQFGSIFNNVVNPRFAGSRGGFSRFF